MSTTDTGVSELGDAGGPGSDATSPTEEADPLEGDASGPSGEQGARHRRRPVASVVRAARSRPRRSIAILVVVLLAAAGVGYWLSRGTHPAAATATTRTVAAASGTIQQSVSSTGTIAPAQDDDLNFAASGTVTSVRVAEGDKVTAGEVLATIDSASLRASLAQAKASLASDQAKVASDQASGISGAQLTADEASVSAAQNQVNSAQSAVSDATLTSPITGVVATVDLTVGEQVSASSGTSSSGTSSSGNGSGSSGSGGSGGSSGSGGFSSGSGSGGTGGTGSGGTGSGGSGTSGSGSSSGSAQLEVISTTSWIVNASVDDTEVGLLAKGDQAQVVTDGATGTVYGLVSSIGVVASSSSSSSAASYPVVVTVTGSPGGLHAGASATVSLIYKQLADVLTVPTLAVHSSGSASYVLVSSGGKQVKRTVTTGVSGRGETQITSGLSAGELVVEQIAARSGTSRSGTGTGTRGGGFGGGGGSGGGGFGGGGFGGGGFGGGGR